MVFASELDITNDGKTMPISAWKPAV